MELPAFAEHLGSAQPAEYHVWIPLTCAAVLLTCAIAVPGLVGMSSGEQPQGERGQRLAQRLLSMRVIAAAPMVISVLKLFAVLAPRTWKMVFLLAAIYEVAAFRGFLWLILGFIAETPEEAMSVLASSSQQRRIWMVPPCCCVWVFCLPCMVPRVPVPKDLQVIHLLMWQFIVIVPVVACMELIDAIPERWHGYLVNLDVVSLLLAMYGLFALLFMAEGVLGHHARCHAKFWAVKWTFIANTVVFRGTLRTVHNDLLMPSGACYTMEALAAGRSAAITAVLMMPLSYLACHYAYRKEDLEGRYTPTPGEQESAIEFVPVT